jgi:hypothetical protein
MVLELNEDMHVVDTNVPDDLRCYADKSRAALRKYIDTDFPEVAYYCCFQFSRFSTGQVQVK